ncbi:MAG: ATP phosphoribosyltransferase regulatory subunit [Thiobacillaceae bacterium]|jgi:ATP phosphoribosyltransferase regulatory subunit|nr:ATP phosphoribosyltransferase regulatory subunit [Thiobacillaceae bacterium]
MNHAWLLPEYVEDILPPYARQVEGLRRRLLELFDAWGYEPVCPPLIEYLDSLLTGAARDLDLKTFKVVDGLSGRMLGVRADITPQAARIDAHLLNRQGVARLCYAGPVLHARPAALTHSRELLQVGAELFGHAGVEADLEILGLLLAALRATGLADFRVSLGHVGLFQALSQAAGLTDDVRQELSAALQAKDRPSLEALAAGLPEVWSDAFRLLPELYGGADMLAQARCDLPALPGVSRALDELGVLLRSDAGNVLSVDLADLRGYGYHTGVVFAAYAGGQAQAIALGGRYDNAGAIFGRVRPATGFSLDLRRVSNSLPAVAPRGGILAPWGQDADLVQRIAELRAAGERVVVELPGQEAHRDESDCDRVLARERGEWRVSPLG